MVTYQVGHGDWSRGDYLIQIQPFTTPHQACFLEILFSWSWTQNVSSSGLLTRSNSGTKTLVHSYWSLSSQSQLPQCLAHLVWIQSLPVSWILIKQKLTTTCEQKPGLTPFTVLGMLTTRTQRCHLPCDSHRFSASLSLRCRPWT